VTAPRHRWFAFSLRTLFVVVMAVAIPLALFTSMKYQYRKALRDFALRHAEATQAIEETYASYRCDGQWPAADDFDATIRERLSDDWIGDQTTSGPMIMLHGPYHSAIVYYFAPPEHESISRTWVLGVEGSKSEFRADVGYSADNSRSH